MKRGIYFLSILVLLIGSFVACRSRNAENTKRTLRLSMIPTNDPGKMLRDSQPLIAYLEKATGAKVEMTIPTNYAAVVEAIANDQVEIAYLGGFSYVQAARRAGVNPLVQRDLDQNFHSLFITNRATGIETLDDLKENSLALCNGKST